MSRISVQHLQASTYRVTVEERTGRTQHDVTVSPGDIERYAPGAAAERLLHASFEFLLERERKESILSRFELQVIERYFPEFPHVIRRRLQETDVDRSARKA